MTLESITSHDSIRVGEPVDLARRAKREDFSVGLDPGGSINRLRWFTWVAAPDWNSPVIRLRGQLGESNLFAGLTVLMIGLGSVGGRVFSEIARLGVGQLFGVDPDRFGANSWLTQRCTPEDAGRSKALVQGAQAHAAHPGVSVITAEGYLQDLPLWILRQADVLLIAGDNLEVLVWAGERATALGKRLIQGAVHGETHTVFLRSWDLRDSDNTCPACGLSQEEWSTVKSRFGCDPSVLEQLSTQPTRTLPHLCAASSDFVLGEAVKVLMAMDEQTLSGEEVSYCFLSHRMMRSKLPRNEACRCPHESWTIRDIEEDPSQVTLKMLIEQLEGEIEPSWKGIQASGETDWTLPECPAACGADVPPRLGRPGQALGRCKCGVSLVASPSGRKSVLTSKDLRRCANIPLRELGVADGGSIGIWLNDRWYRFFIGVSGAMEALMRRAGRVSGVVAALDQASHA